jgi:hypothetical protein
MEEEFPLGMDALTTGLSSKNEVSIQEPSSFSRYHGCMPHPCKFCQLIFSGYIKVEEKEKD